MAKPLYNTIGQSYAAHRREDPLLKALTREALGSVKSVVNIGAGAGAYEPSDIPVVAVEPSSVMSAQRPASRPAVRGTAQALPLHDQSFDAAMTVLSLHHWYPDQDQGLLEMCRVSRDRIVIVTIDAEVSGEMWLMRDYLTEVRELDLEIFPTITAVTEQLDRPATVLPVLIPRDTPDHHLLSFWAHPTRVLDDAARRATSGFARQTEEVNRRVVRELEADLDSGRWDERNGHLRECDALDVGLRLIVAKR